MSPTAAVVGAGITGLVAGRALARAGWRVEVFERWPGVGGMASAFDIGQGVRLERYYHHLFESDSAMTALHDELLPGALEWYRSSVAMFRGGRLWPFLTPVDLLRYGPLPPIDRLRLGLAVTRLQGRTDVARMDHVRAIDWLERTCGSAAVDAVWRPLLLGKFGEDAGEVPLAWLWSKLVLRRRLRRGRLAAERLGYPRGSFQAIADALAAEVRKYGGKVAVDREVASVNRRDGGGYVLACAAPGAYRREPLTTPSEPALAAEADIVVLTVPTFIARGLLDWPPAAASALAAWSYRAAVVLLLELRRPFTRTYWINIADDRVPALGLVEHTNLVPAERYPAHYLYAANYVAADDPRLGMSTESLLEHHLPGLRLISPTFDRADVLRAWSFREPAAQPVPRTPNTPRLLPHEPLPGLYLANMTQLYPEDRGTNYSVVLGQRVADLITPPG